MVTSPQSDASHDSDGGTNSAGQGKNRAPKDKECPYCHQRFTSSSLGRHLDQYIFKKRPDGIHNVEEIRQQRGGITRRTPRQGSAAKRERESSLPTRTSSIDAHGTPPASVDLLNGKVAGGIETKLNALTWHTTGVISDLDVQKLTGQIPPVSKSTAIKRNWGTFEAGQRDSLDSKADAGGDKDTVRALELALREVLGSLQAASVRASPDPGPSPFNFDIQAQTFPALCLLLLPSPPTLFSTAPFGTTTSFSVDPPGHAQLDCLHLKIQAIIHRWKWNALAAAQRASYPNPFSRTTNIGEEHDFLTRTAQQHEDIATKHLELAYAQWAGASEEQRTKQWQLELARAFVSEQEKRKEAEERMERIQQEANRLEAQVDMLSRCQWPREMALWPPDRVPVEKEVIRELRLERKKSDAESDTNIGGSAGGAGRWDFDRLVGKWKKVVREDKSRRMGMMAAHQRPPDTPSLTLPQQLPPQAAASSAHAAETQGLSSGGATNGDEPKRTSTRMHLATSMAEQDDAVREFNKALMVNGNGKG